MFISRARRAIPCGFRTNSERRPQAHRASPALSLTLAATLVLAGASSALASPDDEPSSEGTTLEVPGFGALNEELDQAARGAADRLVAEALTRAMEALSTREDRALATRADERLLANR